MLAHDRDDARHHRAPSWQSPVPKRTSATRPRERLRAGWNVRIIRRAWVHVMSIEGVAGMHGSLPGLAAGRFGVIMFFSACRLPSFAPEDPPSHASENQITTGEYSIRLYGTLEIKK